MIPSLLAPLVALCAVGAQAATHMPRSHAQLARDLAPRTERHSYLLNSTAPRLVGRAKGEATYYHPETEGPSAQGSCGEWMTSDSPGVALSQAGWDYFASKGLSQKEICYKQILITSPDGSSSTARLMDTCPPDPSTSTCLNACDIDLTYGLFGKLMAHTIGIFNVQWSFTDGTPSPCGPTLGHHKDESKSRSQAAHSAHEASLASSRSAAAASSSSASASSASAASVAASRSAASASSASVISASVHSVSVSKASEASASRASASQAHASMVSVSKASVQALRASAASVKSASSVSRSLASASASSASAASASAAKINANRVVNIYAAFDKMAQNAQPQKS